MLSTKYIRNPVFETEGKIQTLLREYVSLVTRNERSYNLQVQLQEIEARLTALSAPSKKQRVDPSVEARPNSGEIDALQRSYETIEKEYTNIVTTEEEDEVIQLYMPSTIASYTKGNVMIGGSFSDPLKEYHTPSCYPTPNPYPHVKGCFITSIDLVRFIYVVDEYQENIGYLRLAFKDISVTVDLPNLVILEDSSLDECLFLTTKGMNIFDIRELLKSHGATEWASDAKVAGATLYVEPIVQPLPTSSSKPNRSRSPPRRSRSPPRRSSHSPPHTKHSPSRSRSHSRSRSPPISTFALKGPPLSSYSNLGMSASDTQLSNFVASLTEKIVSTATPHAVTASLTETFKNRAFLFNVTCTKENVYALLGSAGDVAPKQRSDAFLHDLLDRFHTNVGGSDAREYLSIPFAKDGKTIQALLLGKVPSGLTTINWDPKVSYGSTRLCISHFVPSCKGEANKGFPYIPTNQVKLVTFFNNISMTFQGLFDKNLLEDEDGKGPLTTASEYWKKHSAGS